MEFKIEKKVKLPPSPIRKRYPFGEMGVGDSFLVLNGSKSSIANSANGWGYRHNRKFVVRSMDGGLRCFRIK